MRKAPDNELRINFYPGAGTSQHKKSYFEVVVYRSRKRMLANEPACTRTRALFVRDTRYDPSRKKYRAGRLSFVNKAMVPSDLAHEAVHLAVEWLERVVGIEPRDMLPAHEEDIAYLVQDFVGCVLGFLEGEGNVKTER